MYDNWTVTRWETPVVDIRRLLLVSLVDANHELTLILEASSSQCRARWRVRWRRYPGYRNLDEAFRTQLWQRLDESGQRCGWTFTVEETPPLASWDSSGYLAGMWSGARHYVIATDDDVVEILSDEAPTWETLPPAAVDEPPAGKSTHLYMGEDDAEIQRVFAETKDRQRSR
jgi:hypothetical protein